ncbi:MAG: alpha/beta fold hydrolase [Thermodesulfobacteriota bacterium]
MTFAPHHRILCVLPAMLILLSLAACTGFKNGVYDTAIGRERREAGLAPSTRIIDGLEIAFLEGTGKGDHPTLVLVHGFGASKEIWLRFSQQVKNDFHIIAVDLPGHGESAKPMEMDYCIPNQVSYLRAFLDEMDIDRLHLAGNSMGGAVTALYAARYPDQIASITLFNPGGVYEYESELSRHLARGENPLIVENASDFSYLLDFSMEKKPFLIWPITSVMAERAVANRPINEKMYRDIRRDAYKDFGEVLAAIQAPALIVWGRQDRLIHFKNGRVFDEKIPDSRLVILDEIGHAPMIETPKVSAGLIRDFVAQIASR